MSKEIRYIHGIEFIDTNNYLPLAEKILSEVGNLRLVGETGVGKTTLVHKLAEILKLPLFEIVLTRDTSRLDLLATDILKKGETEIRKGIVVKWLESSKGILYLDGFNYAEPNIISLIESLADFRGSIWINELEQTFKRNSEHYLVISYNPSEKSGYSGTFIENIATIRRFEGLVIDYMSSIAERKLITKHSGNYEFSAKFVELANKTRTLYKEGKLRTPLTSGNLINYARLFKSGLSETEIVEIASSLFSESERELFKRLFESAEKLEIETENTENTS